MFKILTLFSQPSPASPARCIVKYGRVPMRVERYLSLTVYVCLHHLSSYLRTVSSVSSVHVHDTTSRGGTASAPTFDKAGP